MKKTIYQIGIWSLMLLAFVACEEDDLLTGDPLASFGATVSEESFLTYNFTNASQNNATNMWDFGDGTTSEEADPTHTFPEAGEYEVTLTVENSNGDSDVSTQTVAVEDPNAALALLAGSESKTWRLVRSGTSMLLASDPQFTQIYWPGNQNDGTRPCLYDDTFTFGRDGSYTYNDGGTFWAEFGLFNNVAGCDQNTAESCIEATTANLVNACGDDISDWLSGTYEYTFNPESGQLTLAGAGAWIGIPKLGTTGEVLTPSAEETVTVNTTLVDGGDSGVDSMFVAFDYEGAYWAFTYVSHEDESTLPALITEPTVEECDPLAAVSPTIISHTFASNETSEWNLLQPIESGSDLTLGVEDPADATASPVGQYDRVEGVLYQELKFSLDPDNSINFENLSTITLEVYMPSSNAYADGGLTDNVFVGFGNEQCPPDWFTDQHEYQQMDLAKDQWVTVTFNLNEPAYVAVPDNGATVYDRNDMDMIYIAIGGGNHETGATFYIRNFVIE